MQDQPFAELLASAEAGDPEAENAVGRFHTQKIPVPKSIEAAEMWFRRAADQGFVPAMHNLGTLAMRMGQFDLALDWFRAAADKGWVPSLSSIGVLFENAGRGVDAKKLYEIAAKAGDGAAQDALGRLSFALETQAGYESARLWSEKASAQGVARGSRRAASFFLRAARLGLPLPSS